MEVLMGPARWWAWLEEYGMTFEIEIAAANDEQIDQFTARVKAIAAKHNCRITRVGESPNYNWDVMVEIPPAYKAEVVGKPLVRELWGLPADGSADDSVDFPEGI